MSIRIYCYAIGTEQYVQLDVCIALPLVKVKVVDFIRSNEWWQVTFLCVKW